MDLSLGGLSSGMDTAAIVEQLVAIEKQPIYRYEEEISQIEKTKDAWRDINSRLSNLSNKITDLKFSSTYNSRLAESSDETVVTASAANSTAEGSYDLNISQLAKSHRISSDQQGDSTSELGLSGTVNINGTELTIENNFSLTDIRDQINNTDGTKVKASIIDNNLVLESENTGTGTENEIEVSDTSGTVLENLGVVETDGTTIKNTLQNAQDAQLSINGVDITSSTNIIDQSVEGMTFNLKTTGNANIEVSKDTEKTISAVQEFVDQYNSTISFIDKKTDYNSESEEGAVLQGDSTAMRLQSRVRQTIMGEVESGGNITHISQLGVSIDRDGVMTLDSEDLKTALDNNSKEVKKFFNAEESEDGYTGIANKLDSYVDQIITSGSGLIPNRIDSFDQRIENINEDIADAERSVEMARERYTEQFTAMETALSEMQQQQSWMSNQLSSLGGGSVSSLINSM